MVAPIFDGRCDDLEASYAEEVTRHREHVRMEALDRGDEPPAYIDGGLSTQECLDVMLGCVLGDDYATVPFSALTAGADGGWRQALVGKAAVRVRFHIIRNLETMHD